MHSDINALEPKKARLTVPPDVFSEFLKDKKINSKTIDKLELALLLERKGDLATIVCCSLKQIQALIMGNPEQTYFKETLEIKNRRICNLSNFVEGGILQDGEKILLRVENREKIGNLLILTSLKEGLGQLILRAKHARIRSPYFYKKGLFPRQKKAGLRRRSPWN